MRQVLLVDDDKAVIYMLRRFNRWQEYGLRVAEDARDGKEALEKLSKINYDVVITDIRMPGMDGMEFLRELRLRQIDTCLILLSTYNDFEYAQQGIRLGVFDYLTKPVDDSKLCQTLLRVAEHLEKRAAISNKAAASELYYPEAQENLLREQLLLGSAAAISAAGEISMDMKKLYNQDVFKTAKILESLIIKLEASIFSLYPWLRNTEEWIEGTTLTKIEDSDKLRELFVGEIKRLLQAIRKYELHQADSMVKKTCQFVMRQVENDITLELVAQEVNASKDYIGKLFKQKTGCNFSDYVTKIKMEHAKYLIKTGEYKNYEISEKLGYSSPDYFGRLFKNYTGCSPLEYRKKR